MVSVRFVVNDLRRYEAALATELEEAISGALQGAAGPEDLDCWIDAQPSDGTAPRTVRVNLTARGNTFVMSLEVYATSADLVNGAQEALAFTTHDWSRSGVPALTRTT